MATLITKNSSTTTSVPIASQLVQGELAVNVTDKRLFTENSGGSVVELGTNPSSLTLESGTANGVAYLNGSKVLTTGSSLTFDGAALKNTGTANNEFAIDATGTPILSMVGSAGSVPLVGYKGVGLRFGSVTGTGAAGFSEQMQLTSTGLGIGTTSPATKLNLGAGGVFRLNRSDNATYGDISYGGAGVGLLFNDANSEGYSFRFGGTDKMRLDASGNLGLGVVPSAWRTTEKALDVGTTGSLTSVASTTRVNNNAYVNATPANIYKTTGFATQYQQDEFGSHKWFNAPSGTAGNAITFTQAMTLDASGRFLVGQTSAGAQNANSMYFDPTTGYGANLVISHLLATPSGREYQQYLYNGTAIGTITQNGTTGVLYNIMSDYRLKNITGPITSSGAYIDSLKPVEGTWKADGSTFVGLIAHETQEVSRTTVATGTKDGEEMQGMDYSSSEIIANLIAEIQSLRKRLAAAGI